ncbi:MAG TPA: MFS transporter [Acidobacteriota bacterium]
MSTVFLIVFVDLIGFGMVLPLLPLYGHRYGASSLLLGLLLGSYSFMQFIFAPLWGRLSDRRGRRPILLIALAGQALGYLLFGLARGLAVLFVSRILAGICAANIATAQAVVADITPAEQRARGMGLIGAAFGLGFILGPAFGGLLLQIGPTWPGLAAAALSTTALILTWLRLPETLARREPTPPQHRAPLKALLGGLRIPGLGGVILMGFLLTLAFSGLESTFALLVDQHYHFTPRAIGLTFAYLGILSALIQAGLIGRLSARFGERALVVFGLGLTAVGMAIIPAAPNATALLGLLPILAIGMGLTSPALSALASRLAPAGAQGGTLGAYQSAASLARIVGPVWAATGYSGLSHWWPFLTGAGWIALAWLIALTLVSD